MEAAAAAAALEEDEPHFSSNGIIRVCVWRCDSSLWVTESTGGDVCLHASYRESGPESGARQGRRRRNEMSHGSCVDSKKEKKKKKTRSENKMCVSEVRKGRQTQRQHGGIYSKERDCAARAQPAQLHTLSV